MILILTIIFVITVVFAARYALNPDAPASRIEKQMAEYDATGEWNKENTSSGFSDDSAESSFITGMEYYANDDIEEAEHYFEEAKTKSYSDDALPVYLDIYLNECAIQKTGMGNMNYVTGALDYLTEYPSLTNHSYWVWYLVYSVMEDKKSDVSAQELLEQYIEKAKWLDEEEVLLLRTYTAILKNINGEYSESIILFHDILNKAQDLPDSYTVIKTKSNCINYIGDMYYSYEDYKRADDLYQQLIELKIEDPYENAKLKYPAYINLGNIYLKQNKYEEAKKFTSELKTLLPYLPKDTSVEINAFLHNILANIELAQDNLDGAITYFEECQRFLETYKSKAFFDTNVYFGLTQCRILKQTGDLEQAERILTGLLNETIVEAKMKYEVRATLADIYQTTNQTDKYYGQAWNFCLKNRITSQNYPVQITAS